MDNNLKNIPELSDKKNIFGKWSHYFINRHRIVYLMILIILIWGFSSYVQLPREVQPEVIIPYGLVTTTYSGAAPEEIEALITDEIETTLDEIEGIKLISSYSGYGISFIFAEFETNIDSDEMVNRMRTKLSGIQNELPDGASIPNVSSFETNTTPIMIINVSGNYNLAELRTHADQIKNKLESVNNVSKVNVIGGVEREIQIKVDPLKLSTYNLKLSDIKNAIISSHINFPGGDLELDKKNYSIRTVGEFDLVQEMENIVIKNVDGIPLTIKDIAVLVDGYEEVESYSRLSKKLETDSPYMQNSISLSVTKDEGADITTVSNEINQLLETGGFFPEDLTINISGDMSKYVEDELGVVINNSKAGLFLVIIVLFLFIGFWESLIVSFVIPLSIFTAMGFMGLFDITFNTISLFSLILAVGMLVDNGIVVMENVDRLRFLGLDSKLAAEAGTNQIAPAIFASTLTTIAAFFPIALTPGIIGDFIKQIPLTVIFALIASFFMAVTITPTLSSKMLKKHRSIKPLKEQKNIVKYFPVLLVFIIAMYAFRDQDTGYGFLSWFFAVVFSTAMFLKVRYAKPHELKEHFIINRYGEMLYKIVKNKRKKILILVATFLVFILSLSFIPLGILNVEMFTDEDFDRFYINIETPKGSTLEQTATITEEVETILFDVDGIESFVSNIGEVGADSLEQFTIGPGVTPNIARIIIDLKDLKDRENTSMIIADQIREKVKEIPGAEIDVQEIQNGPPAITPVIIRINGNDLELLEKVALDFQKILESINGTYDVANSVGEGYPELQIIVDKNKASKYQLTQFEIAQQVRDMIYGIDATTFKQNQNEFDVKITLSDQNFKSKSDLDRIEFINRFGQSVPFNQVAELKEVEGYTSISHEDLKRQVTVSSELVDGYTTRDITAVFDERVNNYQMPQGVTYDYGGEAEELIENYTQMFFNMIIAVILVFLILAVEFNSLSQPFIILLTVPMSLIGVMFGLVITGNTFTFVAFVGVVALVGIAVNNAIILVDYINYLRENGYELYEAIRKTGKTRFVPVIATTITTAGGILPITLKQPFFGPLGYSIIFGLGTATILTLIIVPIVYSLISEFRISFSIGVYLNF